ncbi:MAG: flagellar hook-basal body complex protein [Rickettsiaceae bacterium]|jgi:flagellar hook protein FlgE|nr:flagellar hook-basal body complex protein [Rickettsiaceae bacterium]
MPQKKQPELSNFEKSKQLIEGNKYGEFKKFINDHPEVLAEKNSKGKGLPLIHIAIEKNDLSTVQAILDTAKAKHKTIEMADKSGKLALNLAKEKSESTKKASAIHDIYKLLQHSTDFNAEQSLATIKNEPQKFTLTEVVIDKFAEESQGREDLTQTQYYDFEESQLNVPASWEELAEDNKLERESANTNDGKHNITTISLDQFVSRSAANSSEQSKSTPSGSFRQHANGNFINAQGEILKPWKHDEEEKSMINLVNNSSELLTELPPVNFNTSSPIATTLVNVGLRLNAEVKFLKGAGEILSLPRASDSFNDGITGEQLIVPSEKSAGRIQLGDILAIRLTPPGSKVEFKYGGIAISNDITAGLGILGANTEFLKFKSAVNGASFRISYGNNHHATFKYKNTTAPNASRGEFNTLETLAEAINSVPGLKARIESNKLHIGTIKGTDSIKFTELSGHFVSALGLKDIPAEDNRFSTLSGLMELMNKTEGLEAVLNPRGGIDFHTELPTSVMKVYGITTKDTANYNETDATDSIAAIYTTSGSCTVRVYMPNHGYSANYIFTFKGISSEALVVANNVVFDSETTYIIKSVGTDPKYGDFFEYEVDEPSDATGFITAKELQAITINEYTSLFKELGLSELKFVFGPSYNAAGGDAGHNLAEGSLTDDSIYVRPLSVYDSLGVQHNFRIAFAKLDNNFWAVEIYAPKNEDGNYDVLTARQDGQIASGTMLFNGDGTLASVSKSLLDPIEIVWKNEAFNNYITFNWGTAGLPEGTTGATTFGKADGMHQVASEPDQRFLDQNGVQPGLLSGISVDKDGYLIASFSNGSTKKLPKIPNAQFVDSSKEETTPVSEESLTNKAQELLTYEQAILATEAKNADIGQADNNSAIDYNLIEFTHEINSLIDIQANSYASAIREKLFNDWGKQSPQSKEKYQNMLANIFKTSFEHMLKQHCFYPEKDCFKAFLEQRLTYDREILVGDIKAYKLGYFDGTGLTDIIYSCTEFSSTLSSLVGRVSLREKNAAIAIDKIISYLEEKYSIFKGEYEHQKLDQNELFVPTLSSLENNKLEKEGETSAHGYESHDSSNVDLIITETTDPLDNVIPTGDVYIRSYEV